MSASLKDYILKGCDIYCNGTLTKGNKDKFISIGTHYSTLNGFKDAQIEDFNNLTTQEGERCFRPLTDKEQGVIKELQRNTDPSISIEENFIRMLTTAFISTQLSAIKKLTIDGLNANPLLCKAIKLNTTRDFIKYYAYQALSRSIVTSMGFFVQDLLLYSNDDIYDGKPYREGYKTKWDIVIERVDTARSFIEVKSGPNDLDSAQVKHYDEEIDRIEENGDKAFIGFTYGKRENATVSLNLLQQYVKNWGDKTLIGKELWDYVSGNEHYHETLMNTIQETSQAFLNNISIVNMIDEKIESLIQEFSQKYNTMDEFYNTLW